MHELLICDYEIGCLCTVGVCVLIVCLCVKFKLCVFMCL